MSLSFQWSGAEGVPRDATTDPEPAQVVRPHCQGKGVSWLNSHAFQKYIRYCEELLFLFPIPGPLLSAAGSGECGAFRSAARDHYLPA